MLQLRYTKKAISHLMAAYKYIYSDSPQNAELVIERIEKAASALLQYPDMGRAGRRPATREFVVQKTPFILVYRYNAATLRILAVLHSAMQYRAEE